MVRIIRKIKLPLLTFNSIFVKFKSCGSKNSYHVLYSYGANAKKEHAPNLIYLVNKFITVLYTHATYLEFECSFELSNSK